MIDYSHANSSNDHTRQSLVCYEVIGQIATGDRRIIGVMLESNLVPARRIVKRETTGVQAEHYRRLHRMGRDSGARGHGEKGTVTI